MQSALQVGLPQLTRPASCSGLRCRQTARSADSPKTLPTRRDQVHSNLTCIAGSGKGSEPPRSAQPNTRSFATHAASSPVPPVGYQRSDRLPDGPQLLSAPEAGAFLVSHPLQDGASSLAHTLVASTGQGRPWRTTGQCCAAGESMTLSICRCCDLMHRPHVPGCHLSDESIRRGQYTDDSCGGAGPLSRSVVLLCSHSLFQGTYGLVINKLMDSQHHPGARRCPPYQDPDFRPVAGVTKLQPSLRHIACVTAARTRSCS